MTEFAYNNAKNTIISNTLFKFDHEYYLGVFFKKKIKFMLKILIS